MKKNKGITLVALVITIIILLILSGVAISMITGGEGLFGKANAAAQKYNEAAKNEAEQLNQLLNGIKEYQDPSGANAPKLATGMSPIIFNEDGSTVKEIKAENWYNYNQKKWANAETKDGSMWVWIPRYAYKITSGEGTSTTGTIEVVFLNGSSNLYNKDGVLTNAVDDGYKIHPSFQAARNGDYSLGQWDSELTGYWVAKFEAGYQQGNAINTASNDKTKAVRSSISYTYGGCLIPMAESGTTDILTVSRNYLDGVYGKDNGGEDLRTKFSIPTETKIAYPVFKPTTYSMNYISNSDMYNLCRVMNEEGNIYGFSTDADIHMIKNSEWGAVAYLTHSKYGLNGKNIYINNVNLDSSIPSVYGVTGYAGDTEDVGNVTTLAEANSWETTKGQKASSTGNIYGIYDLSGGCWDSTTGYMANGQQCLSIWNGSYAETTVNNNVQQISTKYATAYRHNTTYDKLGIAIINENRQTASQYNREENLGVYGDAMIETSSGSYGQTAWNLDDSCFPNLDEPVIMRSGSWSIKNEAGIFNFYRFGGVPHHGVTTRAVIVAI